VKKSHDLNVEAPLLKEVGEYGNEFPALDFKFSNPSRRPKLIKTMNLDIIEARLDVIPSLEYSVEAVNGNLDLIINNFGYGLALDFKGKIDLSCFEDSLKKENPVSIFADEIEEQKVFQFLAPHELDSKLIPDGIAYPSEKLSNYLRSLKNKIPKNDSKLPDREFYNQPSVSWGTQIYIVRNGFPPLKAEFSFNDLKGRPHIEKQVIQRIQRGEYDWRNIYFTRKGFDYIRYNAREDYSLVSPSCTYNILLTPDKTGSKMRFSIAHKINPQSFERFWVIVGSNKSASYKLKFTFISDAEEIIETPEINIKIWNPKNTFFSKGGGRELSIDIRQRDLVESVLFRGKPTISEEEYDYKKIYMEWKSRTWDF